MRYFGAPKDSGRTWRKKASSKKRSFCRTGCFQARHLGGWGNRELAGVYAEAKIQELAKRKMRSGQTGTCQGQWRRLSKTESLSI